jgi:drug/metabolite transporter (DMT)-like permease
VSIFAVGLWLKLIMIDSVRASFFLYLSPIFGFIFATVILLEPFTVHTLGGLIIVLISLYLGQKNINLKKQ